MIWQLTEGVTDVADCMAVDGADPLPLSRSPGQDLKTPGPAAVKHRNWK